jgi:hypothetical protein
MLALTRFSCWAFPHPLANGGIQVRIHVIGQESSSAWMFSAYVRR